MTGPINVTDLSNLITAVQAQPKASMERVTHGIVDIQAAIVRVQANGQTSYFEILRTMYDYLLELYRQAA